MAALGKGIDVLNVELPKLAWVVEALTVVLAVLLTMPNPAKWVVVEFWAAGVWPNENVL